MEPTPNSNRSSSTSSPSSAASSAVRGAAEKVKSAISDVSETARDWSPEDTYQAVQERAGEYTDAAEDFIKKHPFKTVLGATAFGLLVGVILRRRD